LIFCNENRVHHFTSQLSQSEGYAIIFKSSFLDHNYILLERLQLNRLFNYHIESPVLVPQNLIDEDMEKVVREMYNEMHLSKEKLKPEIVRSLLYVLLLKAERAKEEQVPQYTNSHWIELFHTFKNRLESGYRSTRNARDYAGQLNISYKLLNEIIKNFTNKTAKEFIDHLITMEIRRYLASTSLSIKEISYKIGFEEPSNLVKYFKKHTGSTPLKFRAMQ
ncbi:MAG: helix-turn-helix domain-containing protein, partial [Bacteroidota bacterium]